MHSSKSNALWFAEAGRYTLDGMRLGISSFLILLALPTATLAQSAEALMVLAGDQHSAYERTAQVVAAVDRLKAAHPGLPIAILLDGDTLEAGNAVARRSKGIVDFAMFSALAKRAPTVINLGNHETEFSDLPTTVARIHATGARVVSNITDRTTNGLAAASSVTIKLGLMDAVIAGIATDNVSTYPTDVRASLDVPEPAAWAKDRLPSLLEAAPIKIVLSHAGLQADRKILPQIPDGTLFAGAHDHIRLVKEFGDTVYVHSGSWNAFITLAWLQRDAKGIVRWRIEQLPISSSDKGDPELAALIAKTEAEFLEPADRAIVAHVSTALPPVEAARAIAAALRRGTNTDAAFIGNTTFGGGLPAGDVTRASFDAAVRFDGTLFTAMVDGARLRRLLAAANQGPDTPFEQRGGEFNIADGPASIDNAKTYHIVTTDWGAKNSARYFGDPAIEWRPRGGDSLKMIVLSALKP